MGEANLPLASGKQHAAALVRLGWQIRRSGEHIVMTKAGVWVNLSIPNHKEVSR